MRTEEAIPNPSALMESMREIGYSTESAIADLIDNSITAKCKNIDIRFSWNEGSPWLCVIDDGSGMDMNELIIAMRIGSINPLDQRDADDLGRFGLGLKTASLSQSRRFTVVSKKNKKYSIAQWDLDSADISKNNKWSINIFDVKELQPILTNLNNKYLKKVNDGTIVFWDNIDRIDVGEVENKKELKFNTILNNVRSHLELVFHRYLSPSLGKRKIAIKYNESELEAFDPFFIKKSKELPSEDLNYDGSKISVQPYVLPHHSKISKSQYKKYEGRRGYLNEQGFYIYRNRRLIIYANWFRLIPKKEMTKLLRVKIDIPNTLDHLWKIDVKKSNAMPPQFVREKLGNIISKIEIAGVRVYKHKGQKLISNIKDPAWERVAKDNKIYYKINMGHPLVKTHLKGLSDKQKPVIKDLFSVLENSFPQDMYFNDVASEPENINPIELTIKDLEDLLLKYYIREKKPSKQRLKDILLSDPFAKNIELTKKIYKKLKYEF